MGSVEKLGTIWKVTILLEIHLFLTSTIMGGSVLTMSRRHLWVDFQNIPFFGGICYSSSLKGCDYTCITYLVRYIFFQNSFCDVLCIFITQVFFLGASSNSFCWGQCLVPHLTNRSVPFPVCAQLLGSTVGLSHAVTDNGTFRGEMQKFMVWERILRRRTVSWYGNLKISIHPFSKRFVQLPSLKLT